MKIRIEIDTTERLSEWAQIAQLAAELLETADGQMGDMSADHRVVDLLEAAEGRVLSREAEGEYDYTRDTAEPQTYTVKYSVEIE